MNNEFLKYIFDIFDECKVRINNIEKKINNRSYTCDNSCELFRSIKCEKAQKLINKNHFYILNKDFSIYDVKNEKLILTYEQIKTLKNLNKL